MSQWTNLRVKDIVVKIGNGVTPKGGSNVYIDEGIPFLRSQNIHYSGLRLNNVSYISEELSDAMSFSKLKPLDILINITGASIGRTCIIPDNFEIGNISQHIAFLRLKNTLDKYFISYVLKAHKTFEYIMSEQLGASKEAINLGQIARIPIVMPLKISEQIKIVNYLDKKISKIDKEISLLEQKIQKYKELKQTLIAKTVLRGLNKDIELKNSETSWIGDIPKHWTTDRLKNIFDERVGKNLDKTTGEAVTTNILSVMKDIGVINHRDKGNVGNKMAEDITNYKLVYPDDIVVNKMNIMIGSVGISKEFGALSVIYIILITKKGNYAKYYDYFFKMKAFQKSLRRIATGILEIREAVNMTLFMQENMTVPPYEEQVQIANYLDEKTTKIDEIVKTIGSKIEVLKEFRKTLINDVVTGKVKVA